MDELRDRLKHARKLRGWSQEELAKRAGIGQSAIGNMESRAVHSRGGYTLFDVARALGVRFEWLRDGEGPMEGEVASGEGPKPRQEMSQVMARDIADEFGKLPNDLVKARLYAQIMQMLGAARKAEAAEAAEAAEKRATHAARR